MRCLIVLGTVLELMFYLGSALSNVDDYYDQDIFNITKPAISTRNLSTTKNKPSSVNMVNGGNKTSTVSHPSGTKPSALKRSLKKPSVKKQSVTKQLVIKSSVRKPSVRNPPVKKPSMQEKLSNSTSKSSKIFTIGPRSFLTSNSSSEFYQQESNVHLIPFNQEQPKVKEYVLGNPWQKVSWWQARRNCKKMGQVLAVIASDDEQEKFEQFMKRNGIVSENVWIGLTDENEEGNFMWEDGAPLNWYGYTNWLPGEPSNAQGVEHCVEAVVQIKEYFKPGRRTPIWYQWNDAICDVPKYYHYYICQDFAYTSYRPAIY